MKQLYSLAERARIRSEIVRERVNTLIPEFMKREGVDMWIVTGGDGIDEPVQNSMLEEDASNKTVLIFCLTTENFEKYQNYRFMPEEDDPLYRPFLKKGEDTFDGLERLIREKTPKKIAVNTSRNFTMLDGISHTLYQRVEAAAGDIPVVSAEPIALAYIQTRTDRELQIYEESAEIARDLIAEALSPERVIPGMTTTTDIHWYMCRRMNEMGLKYTWGPNVNMQRCGSDNPMIGGECDCEVVLPGDLLHVDFGFSYIQLQTDMQYLAYVRKPGELEAPAGLYQGFETCRAFQQIFMDTVRSGEKGNDLRRELLEKAAAAGMKAMVYSHPIHYFVHGAGPNIGRFGNEGDLPTGEYPVLEHSCFAMELNVRVKVPEWGDQEIFIFREEDIAIVDGSVRVIGELQPYLWMI